MSRPTTTLAKIKAAGPCQDRWRYALHNPAVKKIRADTPITVRQIVETVGINDALWCLRTMPEHNNLWRLYAVRCARRVQHLMTDPRSVAALDVAERYARGKATDEDLAAAIAASSERAASRAAAIAASRAAAWAAIAAAIAASSERAASRAAAIAASRAAAWAAIAAAIAASSEAAWAAIAASRAAERAWQAAELIRICEEIEP